MDKTKTEFMQMIETAKQKQQASWERSVFKIFKRAVCDFIGASYDKIQLKEVANVREANQLIKFRQLENAYILLVLKNESYKMALINIETKKKIASLNYYGDDKVSVKRETEDGATCYVIYNNDKQEKTRIKELKEKRAENKKGSHLDRNSIYFRHKYSYRGQEDKAGFKNKMINLHIKMSYRFMEHDVDYLLNKISEKECKLYNLYQNVRNEFFNKTDKEIKLYKLHIPAAFYEELGKMRDAIIRLKKIDKKVEEYIKEHPELNAKQCRLNFINECKEDIARNYIYIIEKEQTFKENLRDFILINNKTENK